MEILVKLSIISQYMAENFIRSTLRETFPASSKEIWKQIASQELEGKTVEENLSWNSEDGISFSAYYDATDEEKNNISKIFRLTVADDGYFGPAKWLNIPHVTVTSENSANQIALQHLTNGADGVLFKIDQSLAGQTLLKDIDWRYCSLFFEARDFQEVWSFLNNHISQNNLQNGSLSGGFFWDGLSGLENNSVAKSGLKNIFKITSATSVQEIVDALSKGVRFIEATNAEFTAAKSVGFSVNINQHFLESIAKLKSLRFLWFQVMRAYGFDQYNVGDVLIHSRSEKWINDQYQPHGNLLKGTTACMSSIIGGADAITVFPEDVSNSTMNRAARNIVNLLREESHFDKVVDASAGAYAVDAMVKTLSQEAWRIFQQQQK